MKDLSNTLKILFMNMVACVLFAIFNKVYEHNTDASYKNAVVSIKRFQNIFETYLDEMSTYK